MHKQLHHLFLQSLVKVVLIGQQLGQEQLYLNDNQFITIQGDKIKPQKYSNGVIAIIGAGTGLGIAKGLFSDNKLFSLPSEGGHAEFSPRSEKEWLMAQWLKAELKIQRLSIEKIVSGTGLGHIARWRLSQPDAINHPLCQSAENWELNNSKRVDLPSLASESAKNGDEMMTEVLKIWLSAFGSVAGDIALQELCTQGLWLSGGAAAKHLEGIRSITFLEALKHKGRFKDFLEKLPVMALKDQDIGLFSAGQRAYLLAESNGKLI